MNRLDRALEALAAAGLAAMVTITFAEVVARGLFSAPIAYVTELVPDLLVWTTMLGAALAARRGQHLGISTLVDRLGPRARRRIAALELGAAALFFGAVAAGAASMLRISIEDAERMPLGYPAWLIEAAVPVGGLAIVIATALALRVRLQQASAPDRPAPLPRDPTPLAPDREAP